MNVEQFKSLVQSCGRAFLGFDVKIVLPTEDGQDEMFVRLSDHGRFNGCHTDELMIVLDNLDPNLSVRWDRGKIVQQFTIIPGTSPGRTYYLKEVQ